MKVDRKTSEGIGSLETSGLRQSAGTKAMNTSEQRHCHGADNE